MSTGAEGVDTCILVEHARVLARAEPRKLAVCVCSDDGAKAVHEARAQVTMVPRSMAAQV
jgi:hypothetical protein